MQIRPFCNFHGHQSLRRAASSLSIRQHVNFVDELVGENNLKTLFLSFRYWIWTYWTQIIPYFNSPGHQSFRRITSTSSIFLKTLFLSFSWCIRTYWMQLWPHVKLHGHQSFRRASSIWLRNWRKNNNLKTLFLSFR